MRITPAERQAIQSSIHQKDSKAEIYLYGSRTQDHLKGGDIDLLILSEQLNFKDKITLLAEIQLKIGEQKIDLTIKPKASLNSDPFIQSIFHGAIKLAP
jgi:predicted nucleotidyltransferase